MKSKQVLLSGELHRKVKTYALLNDLTITNVLDAIILAACENGLDATYRYGASLSNTTQSSGLEINTAAGSINLDTSDKTYVSGFNNEPDGVYSVSQGSWSGDDELPDDNIDTTSAQPMEQVTYDGQYGYGCSGYDVEE